MAPTTVREARTPLTRAAGAVAGVQAAVQLGRDARDWWRRRRTWTVSVGDDDPIYQDVHDWLSDVLPRVEQRALVARTFDRHSEPVDVGGVSAEPPRLLLTHSKGTDYPLTIDGHRVTVQVIVPDESGERRRPETRLQFTATSQPGQQAVIRRLQEILTERASTRRKPTVWLLSRWGSWDRRSDLPLRPIDSVVLTAGQLERIRDDLAGFLTTEHEHVRRGLPWHRGYLLHGPPGTGKTSIARALADHFGLDLWYAPLGDLDKDSNLLALLSQVHPRSLLLLEDVDVYAATRRDEATPGQVTLSGLLNALDGVATPHGLVTVLTTNDRHVLDDALVRPGRIDLVEHIDLPDPEQAARLFTTFYGRPPRGPLHLAPDASVAALTELFKQHMHDPAAAETALTLREAS